MRRLLLITMSSIAVALIAFSQTSRQPATPPPPESPPVKTKGYVLKPGEGEKLGDPRGGVIKVSPESGSKQLAMAVQPLAAGKRIGTHMHERDEEVFFVHKGKGTVLLDDKRTPVEEGSVVYIPPGTWHGFEAGDDMQLVWLMSPPHFVELYRLYFKPGFEPTNEEEERLLKKYGVRERPRP